VSEISQLHNEIGDLKEQFIELLKSLSATVDGRDPNSRDHSLRVARYSLAIGERLGISSARLERLEIAALLHDIGKLGVETFILAKPATLDELELAAVRYHPLLGVRILEPVRGLSDVILFIRHHHEHFDGSGYPDGLKGEQIPPEARVLAVADAFEAMTSNRPYRKAKTPQEAIRELHDQAGSQFDPGVVNAFQEAFDGGRI
jgi:putative nucleotidyltransferase with HDIG domain